MKISIPFCAPFISNNSLSAYVAHGPIRDKGASFPGGLFLAVAKRILHLKNGTFVQWRSLGTDFSAVVFNVLFLNVGLKQSKDILQLKKRMAGILTSLQYLVHKYQVISGYSLDKQLFI